MRPYDTPEFRRSLRLVERNFQSDERPEYWSYDRLPRYNPIVVAFMCGAVTVAFIIIIAEVCLNV